MYLFIQIMRMKYNQYSMSYIDNNIKKSKEILIYWEMWWSNMRKQSIKERKHFKFKNITAMMTKLCFLQTLFLLLSSFLFCITKKIKKKRNLPFTKNGSRRNGYLNTSFFEHAQRFLLKFMYKTVIYIQILVVVLL